MWCDWARALGTGPRGLGVPPRARSLMRGSQAGPGGVQCHKRCFLCLHRLCHLIPTSAIEMGIMIPGLQMRKLRSKKITLHTAIKCQGRN